MRWENTWQCEARLLYKANRRALGTKDMVTFFFQFVSSPIVWFLAVKQNLSQPKLNLLLLWSRSRRILKEGRVKRLLPQSRSGRIMNRKRQFMTCFKSEEYTSFINRLWPASSCQVLVCAKCCRTSTECRPITDRYIGQVSTNYRQSVGKMSAKCRQSVSERKVISAETHLERLSTVSRPSVDPLSTDYRPLYRPTVDRVSTEYRPTVDRVSTDYRPSVDRLSTECRPLYRPISRSTLPTVNKIRPRWGGSSQSLDTKDTLSIGPVGFQPVDTH